MGNKNKGGKVKGADGARKAKPAKGDGRVAKSAGKSATGTKRKGGGGRAPLQHPAPPEPHDDEAAAEELHISDEDIDFVNSQASALRFLATDDFNEDSLKVGLPRILAPNWAGNLEKGLR
jgi:hypothetical protein